MRKSFRLGSMAALGIVAGCSGASSPPAVAASSPAPEHAPAAAVAPGVAPSATTTAPAAPASSLAGRGWVATGEQAAAPRAVGGRDVLAVALPDGKPMECHVFVEAPTSIVAGLRQAVSDDPDATLELESVGELQGQPALGFMVGTKVPGAAGQPLHLTMVRYYDDVLHPVLCKADRSPLPSPFASTAQRVFRAIHWQTAPFAPQYSELRKRTTDTTVTSIPYLLEAGHPPTQHTESRLYGYEWTFALPGTGAGELRVVERSFVGELLLGRAVETTLTETSNGAKDVTTIERRRFVGGEPETTLSMTAGSNGTCHFETSGKAAAKTGNFPCGPRLASAPAREAILQAADAASGPYESSAVEYIPDLAIDRATKVRYTRNPGDPPHVVHLAADKDDLVADLDENGRFVETALSTPRGKTRHRRIYTSVPPTQEGRRRIKDGGPSNIERLERADASEHPPVVDASTKAERKKRKFSVTVGGATVTGVSLKGVPEQMRGLREPFQACYDQALARDIAEEGYLRISLWLAANGSVERSESRTEPLAAVTSHLSPALVQCAMAHAKKLVFESPPGLATVKFSALFAPDLPAPSSSKRPALRKARD